MLHEYTNSGLSVKPFVHHQCDDKPAIVLQTEDMRYQNTIRAWRLHRGLTQQVLADASGYGKQYISELERGNRKLNQELQAALAGALNCQPADLFSRKPDDDVTGTDTQNLPQATLQNMGVRRSVPLRNPLHTGAWIQRVAGGSLGEFIVFVRPEHATLDLAVRRLDDTSISKLHPGATHVLTAPYSDVGAGNGSLVVFEITHATDGEPAVQAIIREVREVDGKAEFWTADAAPSRFTPPAGRYRIDGVAIQIISELGRPHRLLDLEDA